MGPARCILLVADPGLLADLVGEILLAAGHEVERVATSTAFGEAWGADHHLVVVAVDDLSDPAALLDVLAAAEARILVITEQTGPAVVTALVLRGATSVCSSGAAPEMFLAAVALSAQGTSVLERGAAGVILTEWRRLTGAQRNGATGSGADLTARELDVLAALADGLSAKAVARRLGVSMKTVESHKANLFKKLGVRTQAQAVAVAIQAGLATEARGAPG